MPEFRRSDTTATAAAVTLLTKGMQPHCVGDVQAFRAPAQPILTLQINRKSWGNIMTLETRLGHQNDAGMTHVGPD